MLLAAATLALYIGTLAPGVTWANHGADGGDLMAAAMSWGVPHPSGYPIYILLARACILVPIGSLAYRFNLFSAVAATSAVIVLYHAARLSLPRPSRLPAVCTALCLASSLTFWSQAVITEVYTLSALFFCVCLYMALLVQTADRWTAWAAWGAIIGLGLGAHLTLVLSLPGLLYLARRRMSPRHLIALVIAAAVGLACYVYVPIAASGDPAVNWGDATTWRGFWWLISGRLYRGYLFGLPLNRLTDRLSAWASLWGQQWGWHGVALSLLGLAGLWQRRRDMAMATLMTFTLYALYAIGYDTRDSFLYLIPAYAVSALWAGEGIGLILSEASKLCKPRRQLVAAIALIVGIGIPAWAIQMNRPLVDASDDLAAQTWLATIVSEVPEGALVITGTDEHTFALAYLQHVEQRRRDLLVVDGDLWREAWYAAQVTRRSPDLTGLPESASLLDLVAASLGQRTVVLTSPREDIAARWGVSKATGYWLVTVASADQQVTKGDCPHRYAQEPPPERRLQAALPGG